MRFLRMLTNSMLGGALGAAYLTILVLQLNPQIPLVSGTTGRWFMTLCLMYGVHLGAICYVVMVGREFFSLDVFSPGWASVRVLAWTAAASAAIAAALMWLNVRGLSAALTELAAWRMTAGAIATSVSAAVLAGIAVAHYSFGRRGSRVGASLFAIAVFASVALPLAARGAAIAPPPPVTNGVAHPKAPLADVPVGPRAVMLLLDGASLDYVLPRVAEGRLPAFARLLDKGAVMDLATIRPTQPDPVWAAAATGMYPAKNGIRSAASYYARHDRRAVDLLPDHCFSHALVHLGFVHDEPNASTTWGAPPLWSIVSDAGLPVGIVRWPLTYPAQPVDGFVVSDRFHQLMGSIAGFDRAAFPADALPLVEAAAAAPLRTSDVQLAAIPVAQTSPESSAMARDRLYSRAMHQLKERFDPRLSALRYEGLDSMGHYYLRYTRPRTFRDLPEEERRQFSQVIDRYYAFIDGELGEALDALAPGDLLVVVSGFGLQPLNPVKQALGRWLGGPDFSGTHERAPDGFLVAYGAAAEPGRHQRGSIVDVAPTLLYFLGLPVGRDMDGYARADLFTRAFTAERPVVFIPSYTR